ncbi:MAG: ABC transporter permease [Alphaproteobacteria bacterium]|nr:ABC transporter permease [Alphaproteobacteria bacterium]
MELNEAARPARPTPLFPRRGGGEGALFGVMAIMSFLACLTLALALGAARLAETWERGLTGQATVQILETPGIALEVQVTAALEVLNATPGIASARVMSAAESAELLKPWLGDADLSAVPVPALIAVTLDPARPLDADALRARLSAAAPGASFDDHSRWNAGLTAASSAIGWGAYAILALIALAASASVVFAARAALQAHRDVVDVLHMTGARAAFIAREVQWRFFMLGGWAGLAGLAGAAALAGAALLAADGPEAAFLPMLAPPWRDLVWLAAVPAAAAAIAMTTARLAVSGFLARTA